MYRRFFDPVIIPSRWELEGYDSYLEWQRDQHCEESSDTIDILLLVSIALNIVFIMLLVI